MGRTDKIFEKIRPQRGALSPEEAEELFSTVDETGHSDAERAAREHARRREKGQAVEIDPLSEDDPSGSDLGQVMHRTTLIFMMAFVVFVVLAQVSCAVIRRANTANLSENVTVATVASAMRGGVEWGNGFTQFPEEFTVQEADQNTHRVEVTVLDTTSGDALTCLSNAQVQAAALSVNALLNPNINTVIYHVNVYVDADGNFRTTRFFDFFRPTGETSSFMTFVWTKESSAEGVRFNCTITGVDEATQEALTSAITSGYLFSDDDEAAAADAAD